MALTIDILKNNPLLAALAPEVLAAINTLSVNDETNVVKAAKAEVTSGIWNAVDADLKTLTGKDKPAGVKTYDWLKTALTDAKNEDAAKLKTQVADLTTQVETLKASGGDSSQAAADLKTARTQLTNLHKRYDADLQDWKTKLEKKAAEVETTQLDSMVETAFAGLTFREDLPETVIKVMKDQARAELLNTPREWVEADGRRVPVFKNADGTTKANPTTLAALSPTEIVTKALAEVIVTTPVQGGTGTPPPAPAPGAPKPAAPAAGGAPATTFALKGEVSQTAAVRSLNDHLKAEGLKPGSAEFQDAADKAFTEVIQPASLPVKDPV